MQAVADLLRRGVVGDEDRGMVALDQRRPVERRAARGAVFRPGADARRDEAGRARDEAVQPGAAEELDRDRGIGRPGAGDVDARLAAQPRKKGCQIGLRGRRHRPRDPERDRTFIPGQDRQVAAGLQPEGEIEEILRHVGIRPRWRPGGAAGKALHPGHQGRGTGRAVGRGRRDGARASAEDEERRSERREERPDQERMYRMKGVWTPIRS